MRNRKIKKIVKKEVAMLGILIGLVGMPVTAYAEQTDDEYVESVYDDSVMQPQSISTSVRPMLAITEGTAKVSTYITSNGASKISLTMKLQKKTSSGWDTVKSWSASKESSSLSLSKSASISKGTYRTYAKVTCTKSGKSETKSYSSTSKKY